MSRRKDLTIPTSVGFLESQVDYLSKMAAEMDMSVSSYVRKLVDEDMVEHGIKRKENQYRPTKPAKQKQTLRRRRLS